MNRPDQQDRTRKFLWILAAAAVPFAAITVLLLTSIFGPGDLGVRCRREPGREGRCEVLQSRFLGVAGNSGFAIRESDIAGARALCAGRGVGGRGGANCSVELLLKTRPGGYPVLSYATIGRAESGARALNDYFADPTRTSIVLKDELGATVLIVGGLPLMVAAAVLMLRRRRRAPLRGHDDDFAEGHQ